MLNSVPLQSTARQPRGVVKINGDVAAGVVEIEVDNNSFYEADTFRVTLALSAQPPARNLAWWALQSDISVECLIGLPANPDAYTASDLPSLILGKVDDLGIDPVRGEITLVGRDLTSVLVDSKTTEKFVNQTASQIATTFAKRHGLTPVVTATTTKAGKYYELDHARLTSQMSEWDLLTYLAQDEGFIVYVKGMELHFEPAPTSTVNPYVLQYEAPTADRAAPLLNATSLQFSRNLTLAKDVIVKVHSWNLKQKTGFTVTVTATHNTKTVLSGLPQPTGNAQTYSYIMPNLTREQALIRAQALARQITQHEVHLTAKLPGDEKLDITTPLQVQGTGTAFDQVYYPDNIVRRFSAWEGYRMEISAKNHNPNSMVTA